MRPPPTATPPSKTSRSSVEMAAELKAQEIRAMERYATGEPSENWGAEFWRKFAIWSNDLQAEERQEMAEVARLQAQPAAGEGSGR